MTDDLVRRLEDAIRAGSWPAIMAVFDAWPAGSAREQAIDRTARAIETWEDRACAIPVEVWRKVDEGAAPPPWWPLARHVALGEYDTLDAIDHGSHLTSIELFEPGVALDPLIRLPRLRRLEITGSIDDWSLLARLSHLESFAAHAPPMVELDDQTLPRSLRELTIDGSQLQDTSAFAPLAHLKRLNLDANRALRDLRGLAGLHELVQLSIARSPVAGLTPLAGLAGLRILSLRDLPEVTDPAPLATLRALSELMLHSLQINDLGALASLVRLERLHVGEAPVSDLTPIAGLPRLEHLSLAGLDQLTDLAPLAGSPALATLHLAYLPGVTDARPLSSLPRLRELIIDRTPIGDLAALEALGLQKLVVDRVARGHNPSIP